MKKTNFFPKNQDSDNPGQKSLGQYCNILIFLSFLGSLLKRCILFENLLQFSFPSTLYKVETRKKIMDTRVQNCLWGDGRGWTCVNVPQMQKYPKTFVHDCRLTN